MNMDSKLTYTMFAVVLIVALGAYFFPVAKNLMVSGATPAGGYNVTPFGQSIVANLAAPGSNGTSTSILNTSANDYYITGLDVGCQNLGNSSTAYTGAGLASLTVFAATSSTAAPASNSFNSNKVGGGNITIATSTASFAISTSTAGGTSGALSSYIVWSSGTYLTWYANATNTAACTFTAKIISS